MTDVDDIAALTARFGKLGAALRAPEASADLADLAAAAKLRHIRFRLSGMAAFAADPGLAGRLRGAFGAVLMQSASPEALRGDPCPWAPPCAFEALFRKQGRMTPGIDFPSPWLISLDPARGDLNVTLTLFGMACEWAPSAADAMTAALLSETDWAGKTGLFAPKKPEILARRLEAADGVHLPAAGVSGCELMFLSPLVISNTEAADDPVPAFTGMGHRLEGVARWHGLTLGRVDWHALAQTIRRCEFEWLETQPVSWRRGSKRQGRSIIMSGAIGRLSISARSGMPPEMLTLLALGAAFRIGADAAFGCGRYSFKAV